MKHKNGFTIVELLIVIVVIGILAALVLTSFAGAQEKAKVASANSGIEAVYKAMKKLEADTGRSAFGCLSDGNIRNPEGPVTHSQAGIMSAPALGTVMVDTACVWTASDVNGWQGPYLDTPKDPWGSDYFIDYDYNTCPNGTAQVIAAVMSLGPNKTENYPGNTNSGACTVVPSDDIYRRLN